MRLLRFQTSRFGGLQDVERTFCSGINVIEGPNESGKSTLVNGIQATLFREVRVGKNTREGREFFARFLPFPDGDTIDGELTFAVDDAEYTLYRQWGTSPQVRLTKPDGTLLTSESEVEAFLDTLFPLGRRTYQTIVFARQEQLKDVLDLIRSDETVDSIGSMLRKAVMQLDGVSVDRLGNALTERIQELLGRWDIERDGPEGNRGYHNPWKAGVGSVLQAYYTKEELKAKLEAVAAGEAELTRLRQELAVLDKEKQELTAEIKTLADLEADVFKRTSLEPKLKELQDEAAAFKTVVAKWPEIQQEHIRLAQEIAELEARKQALEAELDSLQAWQRHAELEQLYKQVSEQQQEIRRQQERIAQLPATSPTLIKKLDALQQKVLQAEASMQAGTLLTRISVDPDVEVYVTRDLDAEQKLVDPEVRAQGWVRFRIGKLAEIEVRAGEQDFAEIKESYRQATEEIRELLAALKLESVQEARDTERERKQVEDAIAVTEQTIQSLLGGKELDQIKAELAAFETRDAMRTKEDIVADRQALENELIDKTAVHRNLERDLAAWTQEYGSYPQLIEKLGDVMGDLRALERELSGLKPVPEEFQSPQAFNQHLAALRARLENVNSEIAASQKAVYELQRELPVESLTDLENQHQDAERRFSELKLRAEKILQVHQAFQETVAEMDSTTFAPLASSFSRYLAAITRGQYKLGHVDDKFNLDLVTNTDKSMPVNLLSSGTYDSTALALRFALLENIFGRAGGLVVLDDCLVDLDPGRKQAAVDIIRDYANSNQVVFTTCSPETARLLEV